MAKRSSSKTTSKQPKVAECKFVDRNLKAISPKKEQFEPTAAAPMRQHYRMAGGG